MMVVAKLLGLPDADADELIRLSYATTSLLDGIVTTEQLEAAGLAAMELAGYVMTHFQNAGTDTQPGLISDLADRCASGAVGQLPAMNMMITLFSAAGESTASLLGSAAWLLADRPAIQRQRREDPELFNPFEL